MLDSLLASFFPAMITLYWICLVVGGGLLFISTVVGGDAHGDVGVDADLGGDFHADVDSAGDIHVGDAPAASLASWFSMQFVIFFMAMFGLLGVTLTHLTDTGAGTTLGIAAFTGLLVGQGVHQLLSKLRRTSGNSASKPGDYINKVGRVTVNLSDHDKGEVAIHVGRTERFIPAVSKREGVKFSRGQDVAVVDYEGGVAHVVSREEFEFLSNSN